MTDLIDRIRAYVAAIPTHECAHCHAAWPTYAAESCPKCGHPYGCAREVSAADALLREVAALEPKAYLVHDGRAFVDAAYIDEGYATKQLVHRRDGATLSPLYTLTGATHE